jgi:hypothetical protein
MRAKPNVWVFCVEYNEIQATAYCSQLRCRYHVPATKERVALCTSPRDADSLTDEQLDKISKME